MVFTRSPFLAIVCILLSSGVCAQLKKADKAILYDTLDGKLDMSRFLIELHGFIPIPFIITEPALGGFGVGMAPVFIKKRPPVIDTVRGKAKLRLTPPDITGFAGIYTINNSYLLGAFRLGSWVKMRAKYRIISGYGNINLGFYHTIAGEEVKSNFNFKMVPLAASLQKYVPGTHLSGGIKYLYLQTKVSVDSESLPEFVTSKEIDSRVSMPGIITEYDNRDNIFTPDKGYFAFASVSWSNSIFGSDYDYENLSAYGLAYYPLRSNLIAGFRLDMQQVFGSPPFYLKPFINLRGIPAMRYQGNIYSLTETEFRWDFVPRWSTVFFAGSGKAYDTWSEFDDSAWRSSGGVGIRYLVARQFKLRMGVDVARGPEQWAYYIVFGSSWSR
jgi:hypothetical protein